MSRYCPVCGKISPDTAGHCDVCGTSLDAVEAVAVGHAHSFGAHAGGIGQAGQGNPGGASSGPQGSADGQPMSGPICPKCRRGNRSLSVFCAYCGFRLKSANGQSPASSTELRAQAYAGPVAVAPAPPTAPILHTDVSGNIPSGVLLKRRYRILRKIAQGGMGAVYESVDVKENDGRRWAVKEMSPAALPASERTQAITDFRREALILHGLKHPNLPEVLETFEEMNRHFLVMEFIAGRTLLNVVDTSPGFIPEERLLTWARQIFEVLHYLHAQDPPIIYRDVKPANIMLIEGTERIKLIDFGIARFHRQGKASDTEAFGTAGYAPPEQYGKGQTDQRSDIYALGATLHHLVTKQDPSLNPFNWVPARRLNPNVSATLENALMVATSLDQTRRFRSMDEFAQALGIYLPGSTPHVRSSGTASYNNPRPYTSSVPVSVSQPVVQKPTKSAQKKSAPAKEPAKAAPVVMPAPVAAPVQVAASAAQASTATQSAEIVSPTNTGVVDESQIGPPPSVQVAAPPKSKPAGGSASSNGKGSMSTGTLVVSDPVLDLGEARWNSRVSKQVPITSTGGSMRGMVLATQPWIAYNPAHFQGNAVTLDVRVKRRQLKFGRVELQVPNLFAIIWSRTRRVLPFIMVWFWLIVLVTSSFGRTLLTGAALALGGLLALEGLMWLWAKHVRLLVPAEKVNTGRLMVKSSNGDGSIEVRVLARPSWAQRTWGWTIALVLFVLEITLVTWLVLSLTGFRLP